MKGLSAFIQPEEKNISIWVIIVEASGTCVQVGGFLELVKGHPVFTDVVCKLSHPLPCSSYKYCVYTVPRFRSH